MPILPVAPPVTITPPGGFDYVTVDAVRRRAYAAQPGAQTLVVIDMKTGDVLKKIHVGHAHGVAVNPANGHVFTGNGIDDSVSEIDPVAGKVLRTVKVDGHVDAIAYDARLGRVYADEDDGTRMFVVDTKTFKVRKNVALPGHKPEYLVIDPTTHIVYQNIDDKSEIAVIDPTSLTVVRTIPTPELIHNHPLQFDAANNALLVAGENHVLSVYGTDGKLRAKAAMPTGIDQCSWDPQHRRLACAGGSISVFSYSGTGAPVLIGQSAAIKGAHTLAVDPVTGTIFVVWTDRLAAHTARYKVAP